MKTGLIKTKFASCEVCESTALPEHLRNHVLEVTAVQVARKHRRRGHATALLRIVCAQADLAGKTLLLNVAPFEDAMTAEQLQRWYGDRFGFAVIQQDPILMARAPNQTRILRSA